MNTREAMKITIRHLFEWLEEEKGVSFTKEKIDDAIYTMHDDATFFEGLLDWFEEHIEMFGENYGLTIDEE